AVHLSLTLCAAYLRAPHSFPTRRSSDLTAKRGGFSSGCLCSTSKCRRNFRDFSPRRDGRFRICQHRRAAGITQSVGQCLYEPVRSEEHTSELQSRFDLVCRLLLEKKKTN